MDQVDIFEAFFLLLFRVVMINPPWKVEVSGKIFKYRVCSGFCDFKNPAILLRRGNKASDGAEQRLKVAVT